MRFSTSRQATLAATALYYCTLLASPHHLADALALTTSGVRWDAAACGPSCTGRCFAGKCLFQFDLEDADSEDAAPAFLSPTTSTAGKFQEQGNLVNHSRDINRSVSPPVGQHLVLSYNHHVPKPLQLESAGKVVQAAGRTLPQQTAHTDAIPHKGQAADFEDARPSSGISFSTSSASSSSPVPSHADAPVVSVTQVALSSQASLDPVPSPIYSTPLALLNTGVGVAAAAVIATGKNQISPLHDKATSQTLHYTHAMDESISKAGSLVEAVQRVSMAGHDIQNAFATDILSLAATPLRHRPNQAVVSTGLHQPVRETSYTHSAPMALLQGNAMPSHASASTSQAAPVSAVNRGDHITALASENLALKQEIDRWRSAGAEVAAREARVVDLIRQARPPAQELSRLKPALRSNATAIGTTTAVPDGTIEGSPPTFFTRSSQTMKTYVDKEGYGYGLGAPAAVFIVLVLVTMLSCDRRVTTPLNRMVKGKTLGAAGASKNAIVEAGFSHYAIEISEIQVRGVDRLIGGDVCVSLQKGNNREMRSQAQEVFEATTLLRYGEVFVTNVNRYEEKEKVIIWVIDRHGVEDARVAKLEITVPELLRMVHQTHGEYFQFDLQQVARCWSSTLETWKSTRSEALEHYHKPHALSLPQVAMRIRDVTSTAKGVSTW